MAGLVIADANVLLDILTADPRWLSWSSTELRKAKAGGTVAVNPIICAEIAPAFDFRLGEARRVAGSRRHREGTAPIRSVHHRCRRASRIPSSRWLARDAAAGFLHRRSRRIRGLPAAHSRRRALQNVFSKRHVDRTGAWMKNKRVTPASYPACLSRRSRGGASARFWKCRCRF